MKKGCDDPPIFLTDRVRFSVQETNSSYKDMPVIRTTLSLLESDIRSLM